jgi:hypothetical protein
MGLAGRPGLVYWTGWVTNWVGLWVAYKHGLADFFIHFHTRFSLFLPILALCSLSFSHFFLLPLVFLFLFLSILFFLFSFFLNNNKKT